LIKRTIRYEEELDKDFAREIASIPGGEGIWKCIQCGTCSATCPISSYMDYTPRKIVAMAKAGFKEVLKSFTIWLCASCYACTVQCPREIKVTDLMYAFKRKAIEEGIYPKFPIPAMAKNFFGLVRSQGRNTESWLMVKIGLDTNPFRLIKMAPLGLKLLLKGRMSIKRESIKGKEELRKVLKSIR
jgi:heterodisulfide reductase subunit C